MWILFGFLYVQTHFGQADNQLAKTDLEYSLWSCLESELTISDLIQRTIKNKELVPYYYLGVVFDSALSTKNHNQGVLLNHLNRQRA